MKPDFEFLPSLRKFHTLTSSVELGRTLNWKRSFQVGDSVFRAGLLSWVTPAILNSKKQQQTQNNNTVPSESQERAAYITV